MFGNRYDREVKKQEKQQAQEEKLKKKQQKEQQKQEMKLMKQEKKAKLKKRSGMKAVRIFVWTIIVFVLARGTVTLIKGDPLKQMEKNQVAYAEALKDENTINRKVFGFAENFVQKYYTYSEDARDEYASGLEAYMEKDSIRGLDVSIKGDSVVRLAKGYDIQKYSDSQVDVYVYVQMNRTIVDEAATEIDKKYKYVDEDMYLKIPIYIDPNTKAMIVEDVPLLVGKPDIASLPDDESSDFEVLTGTSATKIQDSIEEFLKVYYTSNQTQVDYFLTEPGKIKTASNGDQFEFDDIKECKATRLDNENYLTTVEYTILDNGLSTKQKINIKLKLVDGRYLVEELNTRCTNLNIKTEGENNE